MPDDPQITSALDSMYATIRGYIAQTESILNGASQSSNLFADKIKEADKAMRAGIAGAESFNQSLNNMNGILRGGMKLEQVQKFVAELEAANKGAGGNAVALRSLMDMRLQEAQYIHNSLAAYKLQGEAVRNFTTIASKLGFGAAAGKAVAGGKGAAIGGAGAVVEKLFPIMGQLASTLSSMSIPLLVITTLINGLWGALKGGVDVNKQLLGAVATGSTSIIASTRIFGDMSIAAAWLGLKTEDAMAAVGNLSATYGVHTLSIRQSGMSLMDYMSKAAVAAAKTMAYGQAVGLSVEEVNTLTASLTQMGTPALQLELAFGAFKVASEKSLMTVKDFSKIMSTLAPVSTLTTNAVSRTEKIFMNLGQAVASSNDPLLKMIQGTGQFAVVASAFKGLAEASAKMDLGPLMAVVTSKGPTANFTDAMTKAAQASRPEAMISLLDMVGNAVTDSADRAGVMAMYLKQQGMSLNEANIASHALVAAQAKRSAAAAAGDAVGKKAAEEQIKQLAANATASALIKDPLLYISQMMEAMLRLISGWAAGGVAKMIWGGSPKVAPVVR